MDWVASLVVALGAVGAALLAYTLTANLERQPEYPAVMTDAMRVIGVAIAVAGLTFGLVMLGYAVVAFVGR